MARDYDDQNDFFVSEALGSLPVKAGAGVLHSVIINTKGASSNVLTLYEGTDTTGRKIATIDTTVQIGELLYDINFQRGLYMTNLVGTAAKVTITFQ